MTDGIRISYNHALMSHIFNCAITRKEINYIEIALGSWPWSQCLCRTTWPDVIFPWIKVLVYNSFPEAVTELLKLGLGPMWELFLKEAFIQQLAWNISSYGSYCYHKINKYQFRWGLLVYLQQVIHIQCLSRHNILSYFYVV